MKKTFFTLLFLYAFPAFSGESIQVPKDTETLQLMDTAEVSMHPLCPPDVDCVADGTAVKLKFMIPTCLDSIGPVSFKQVANEDKSVTLSVSAYAFINKNSDMVGCPSHTETVTIALVGQSAPIKVEFVTNLVNAN